MNIKEYNMIGFLFFNFIFIYFIFGEGWCVPISFEAVGLIWSDIGGVNYNCNSGK